MGRPKKERTALVVAGPYAPFVELVVNSLPSEHSRRSYGRALVEFLAWCQESPQREGFTRALVQKYLAHLSNVKSYSPQNMAVHLAAIRKLAKEAFLNGALDAIHEQGIRLIDAPKQEGRRTGNWLTRELAQELLNLPDITTLRGIRDRAVLAVLLGCGLRRTEMAALTVAHIQQREGRWAIIDIHGKRDKIRTVPMPGWAKVAIDEWLKAAKIADGAIIRPINRGGRVEGECVTPQAIRNIVIRYTTELGHPSVAPHDLRRTYAKLALKGKAKIDQISLSLGHASIQTTQRYLGVEQDFDEAPCDVLGIKLNA